MARPGLDDPAIRAWRDQTLYRLLMRASRAETTTTLRRVQGRIPRNIVFTNPIE